MKNNILFSPPPHPDNIFELSGPARLRKHFFPRVRLRITDVAPIIGVCRDRIYKRARIGQLDLKIQRDEAGQPFVTVDDLIRYLYPCEAAPTENTAPVIRRGRPRKSVIVEGGAK